MITKLYRNAMSLLPDAARIGFLHYKATGSWPNLDAPATFSDKMCWRKIHLPRHPKFRELLARTGNKVTVRDYVAERFGADVLTRDFHSATNSRHLPFARLPERFILKASHGSTWNHIVTNKSAEDLEALHRKCDAWLSQSWGEFAGEWWYSMGQPSVLVEEYLDDGSGQPPSDYKFFVTRGQVQMIQVDFDRFAGHKRNLYYPNWKLVPATLTYPNGRDVPQPDTLPQMMRIAEALGAEFDFVRVDLYSVGQRIVFGELTHCPGSGWEKFEPASIDAWLGSMIQLPSVS
jgi:hypothetical protein